jgi:NifU-like protein involved in Fe-S cluster formation
MDATELTGGVECAPGSRALCCGGSTRPPTLTDYIDRGLRRRRTAPLPIAGAVRRDDAGRFARFSLRVTDGVITDVAFEATTCVTLVAYCEVAAEWATDLTVGAAALRVRMQELVAALPLVPPNKHQRALLVVQAVMAALVESARRRS